MTEPFEEMVEKARDELRADGLFATHTVRGQLTHVENVARQALTAAGVPELLDEKERRTEVVHWRANHALQVARKRRVQQLYAQSRGEVKRLRAALAAWKETRGE